MQRNLNQGLVKWETIATVINDIIETSGSVDKNNPIIWKEFLHSWNNKDWLDILTAVAEVEESYPELLKSFQIDAFHEAAQAIIDNRHLTDRVLDTKEYKKVAWKCIMSLNEVWNACRSTPRKHKPELFDIE